VSSVSKKIPVGNSSGDDEFRRAAETRAAEIQNDGKFDPKKDKVVLLGVYSKDQVQKVFDIAAKWGQAGYGGVAQVQIFSHAGPADGPVFHNAQTGKAEQFSPGELRNLRINWEPGGEGYFIGCYTANFAQNFANAQNVTAYGYEKYAYFSSDPNKRVGPNATGPLYLFQSDGYANGTYMKYLRGNSERYPMVRKDPNRRR